MAPSVDPKAGSDSITKDDNNPTRPSARDVFDSTISGARERPFVPLLKTDKHPSRPVPRSLPDYHQAEGEQQREARLRALWHQLPKRPPPRSADASDHGPGGSSAAGAAFAPVAAHAGLTPDRAEKLRRMYVDELLARLEGNGKEVKAKEVTWSEFQRYAESKESELWSIFHDELDLDGNGHLDAGELAIALSHAGISLTSTTLTEFMTFLTSSPHSHAISFPEFRDFLLLLPRHASTIEIYRYYQLRKFLGDDGHGAARVTMEGDVSLSAEDVPPKKNHVHHAHHGPLSPALSQDTAESHSTPALVDHPSPKSLHQEHHQAGHLHGDDDEEEPEYDDELEEDEHPALSILGGSQAAKFLLAGGIAGAVSRTATAPFDRLKVFLITKTPEAVAEVKNGGGSTTKVASKGAQALMSATASLYAQGGIRAFWVGNGLNVTKIFPESAIKFLSYESSKRLFAKYYDHVENPSDISGVSRFLSGGIGGITSQLSIYPIETLKTQMMSTSGSDSNAIRPAMQRLWAMGGMRAYYRGLVIGLIGVFPYSAIDMSTFEALKIAYIRSTHNPEPGVLALLAFGSISGSVGATSVYPLNLVRTKLQASGSSGHPEKYTGMWDVTRKTMERDGWRGFYKGLVPTLAKVVPAVSISYVVYEHTKKRLGV